jgi:hypothetical protein
VSSAAHAADCSANPWGAGRGSGAAA